MQAGQDKRYIYFFYIYIKELLQEPAKIKNCFKSIADKNRNVFGGIDLVATGVIFERTSDFRFIKCGPHTKKKLSIFNMTTVNKFVNFVLYRLSYPIS